MPCSRQEAKQNTEGMGGPQDERVPQDVQTATTALLNQNSPCPVLLTPSQLVGCAGRWTLTPSVSSPPA